MGTILGNAYGLGAALGLASYFASVGDGNVTSSVVYAGQHASALQMAGINANDPDPLAGFPGGKSAYNAVIDARNTYGERLKALPHHLDLIYDLGVSIALAEGQLSAGTNAANEYAHAALKEALAIAQAIQPEFSFANPSEFSIYSDYNSITALRQQWQNDFNNAPE